MDYFEQRTRQLLTADDTQKGTDNMALTLSVFQFAEQNHRFFKTLLGKQSNGMFNKIIYEFMLLHAREHLKLLASRGAVDSFQSEIVAHYFVSAFTGILVWWVTNDMPCSTDEINERFKELAMPAIRSVVG